MIKFFSDELIEWLDELENCKKQSQSFAAQHGVGAEATENQKRGLQEVLDKLRGPCELLKLTESAGRVAGFYRRLINMVQTPGCSQQVVQAEIEALQHPPCPSGVC